MFLTLYGPPVKASGILLALTGRGVTDTGVNVSTSRSWTPDHPAWDLAMPVGTEVIAQHAGVIAETGDAGDCGNTIVIEGMGRRTRYCHLSYVGVQVGQRVSKGMVIGKSGNTGNSKGPHLHTQTCRTWLGGCTLSSPRVALGLHEGLGWGLLVVGVLYAADMIGA